LDGLTEEEGQGQTPSRISSYHTLKPFLPEVLVDICFLSFWNTGIGAHRAVLFRAVGESLFPKAAGGEAKEWRSPDKREANNQGHPGEAPFGTAPCVLLLPEAAYLKSARMGNPISLVITGGGAIIASTVSGV